MMSNICALAALPVAVVALDVPSSAFQAQNAPSAIYKVDNAVKLDMAQLRSSDTVVNLARGVGGAAAFVPDGSAGNGVASWAVTPVTCGTVTLEANKSTITLKQVRCFLIRAKKKDATEGREIDLVAGPFALTRSICHSTYHRSVLGSLSTNLPSSCCFYFYSYVYSCSYCLAPRACTRSPCAARGPAQAQQITCNCRPMAPRSQLQTRE